MKNLISLALIAASATVGATLISANSAQAFEIRDHRFCQVLDPNCPDHRGPVVVVPPRPLPPNVVVQNPPTVIIDPVRPQPVEPPHHQPDAPHWNVTWDLGGDEGISCAEGRSIVRQEGYRQVKVVDCSGDIYRYNAYSNAEGKVTVLVNMDGDIVRVNRWVAYR